MNASVEAEGRGSPGPSERIRSALARSAKNRIGRRREAAIRGGED